MSEIGSFRGDQVTVPEDADGQRLDSRSGGQEIGCLCSEAYSLSLLSQVLDRVEQKYPAREETSRFPNETVEKGYIFGEGECIRIEMKLKHMTCRTSLVPCSKPAGTKCLLDKSVVSASGLIYWRSTIPRIALCLNYRRCMHCCTLPIQYIGMKENILIGQLHPSHVLSVLNQIQHRDEISMTRVGLSLDKAKKKN